MEPACEVSEKVTREKIDGNENMSTDDKEKIEVLSDEGYFTEEDWKEPEQNEVPEWTEPDKPMTMETSRGGRKKSSMRYNRYGDDFLIDKIKSDEIGADMVSMSNFVSDKDWPIINNNENSWQEDHAVPEEENDLEKSEIEKRENTNLRFLEWIRRLPADDKETQSNRQMDISFEKYAKDKKLLFGWIAYHLIT